MKIINLTKNTVLADKLITAQTLPKRIKGLLGVKQFSAGQALMIKPCQQIHTLFMRFAIDVLFVDAQFKVIAVCPRLVPWRITALHWQAKFAVEFPAGTISQSSTQKGDLLEITP